MDYEAKIRKFLVALNQGLSKDDYELVKNNLEINIKKINFASKDNGETTIISGSYSPNGIITMHKENDEVTFYHELLHASSSYYDESQLQLHSGFHHQHINEKKDIGRGFNEGYTELLTQRFFGADDSSGYLNELHYAKLIEHLIGRDEMQSLYFRSNLNGLIAEMCKYNSLENVLMFFENLDKFIILEELKEEKIKSNSVGLPDIEYLKWFEEFEAYIGQTYDTLNSFIFESFLNKLQGDPDYDKKKAELINVMSEPLTFNFKEYQFNVDTFMKESNRKV